MSCMDGRVGKILRIAEHVFDHAHCRQIHAGQACRVATLFVIVTPGTDSNEKGSKKGQKSDGPCPTSHLIYILLLF